MSAELPWFTKQILVTFTSPTLHSSSPVAALLVPDR